LKRGILPRSVPAFLVRTGARRPGLVFAVAAAVVAGAVLVAGRVSVETDILALVPEDDPAVAAFTTTVERFGSVDIVFAVVDAGGDENLDRALAMADAVAAELRRSELVEWVEYRLESPERAMLPLLDRALPLLPPEELDRFLDDLTAEGGRRVARRLRSELLAPQGLAAEELLRLDPAGISRFLLGALRIGGIGASFDPVTGYLVDPGRRYVLVLAKPTGPAQEIVFDRKLAADLERAREAAAAAWREEGWEGTPPRVRFGGGHVTVLEDSRLVVRDLAVGVATSLVGVMALLAVAFGRGRVLVNAAVPLFVGLAATLGFGAVALGRLNSVTSAFAALLIGLGVDFVIVLTGRYADERSRGVEPGRAVAALGGETGAGVLLGATTTAATFLAFLITDFRGLSELGLLTGVGILLLAMAALVLLPALLARTGDAAPPRLRSFGTDRLCRAAVTRPRVVAVLALVVTAVAAAGLLRLRFDDDIRNMRSSGNRGVLLRREVMAAFGIRLTPMMVRADGATEEEALRRARAALERIEPLVDGENLARVDSVAALIPARARQMEAIAQIRRRVPDPAAAVRRLADALAAEGLAPEAFREGLAHLEAALSVRRPLSLAELEGTALGPLVSRYVARSPDGYSTVILCYPPAGRWRRRAPPPLEAALRGLPGVILTGPNVVSAALRRLVWRDAVWAGALGLVLVFALLAADLGGVRRALAALTPLGLGLVWMLGAMGWLGVPVNLLNIFVVTMVIGIGVDYGVHLLHRWDESGGDPEAVAETAKAVAVAALTTVVGFGSLGVSHFPGLRSVGVAATLGAVATAAAAITVLPVALRWRRRCDAE